MPRAWSAEADSAPQRRVAALLSNRRGDAADSFSSRRPTWRRVDWLGRGGAADVWRAVDADGIAIAAKVARTPRGDASLIREHALLVMLAHPNVVATHGLVTIDGRTALALECLDGGDLVALLGAHPRHWLGAARDIRDALAHVHAEGFVHRDVKARNVLFGADGRARLVDFSSAAACGAPAALGGTTAAHRPAVFGAAVDPADDVYAFAVLMYELLAGRLPFGVEGPSVRSAARASWPLAPAADPPARRLAERTLEVLARPAAGLSAFADVLEADVLESASGACAPADRPEMHQQR